MSLSLSIYIYMYTYTYTYTYVCTCVYIYIYVIEREITRYIDRYRYVDSSLKTKPCHILPPSETPWRLCFGCFTGSEGKRLFHRIG